MLLALALVLLVWLCLAKREGFEVHLKADMDYGNVFSSVRESAGRLVHGIKMAPEHFVSYLPFRRHIRRFRRNLL
jgi:hypothetical protein